MKMIIVFVLIVWMILIPAGMSEEEKLSVLAKPEGDLRCQVLNRNWDCQMIENHLAFEVNLANDYVIYDSELEIVGGGDSIKAYFQGCENISRSTHVCNFIVQPFVKTRGDGALIYDMNAYLYIKKEGSSKIESVIKSIGDLRITPVTTSDIVGLDQQKEMLKSNFLGSLKFIEDSLLDSGMCISRGFEDMGIGNMEGYESELTEVGGYVSHYAGEGATFFRASGLLISLTLFLSDKLEILIPSLNDRLFEMLSRGYNFGFSSIESVPDYDETGFFDFIRKTNMTCEDIRSDYSEIYDIGFFEVNMKTLLDCLENKNFSECKGEFEKAEKHVIDQKLPETSRLEVLIGQDFIRDGAHLCKNVSVKVDFENLDKVGSRNISVFGLGEYDYCENNMVLEDSGCEEFDPEEFLCGVFNYPLDGTEYKIAISGKNDVVYNVMYYDNRENCVVEQVVIPV